MTELINLIGNGIEQLTKSPIWVVISLMSLAIGLVCKWVKFFPNRFIPLVVIPFSTTSYALLGDASKIEGAYPRVILAFYGFLLGFVIWAAHKFLLKKLERFLPKSFFPPGTFDTEQFNKPEPEPSQPSPLEKLCPPKNQDGGNDD